MKKEEWKKLVEKFEDFLHREFDKRYKKKDETHRWLFCWDGEQNEDPPFDCGCCLTDSSIISESNCGCICHERISEIMGFMEKELSSQKQELREKVEKMQEEAGKENIRGYTLGYIEALGDVIKLLS